MRSVCLLLLLANALYLGWSQLIDVRSSDLQRKPVVANPPPRIVLAREAAVLPPTDTAEQPAAPAVTEPAVAPATPPPATPRESPRGSSMCTSVGPFASVSDATTAEAALRAAGFEPRQRAVQGELWAGYWVSVQNFATREAAEQAMKSLTDKGMTDVYVLPGADIGNVVSLGVFSERQRAERRADEARAIGLNPQIDDRKRSGTAYWVDVDQPAPVQPVDTSIFTSDPGKIMRLELRDCPATTVE